MTSSKRVAADWRLWGWGLLAGVLVALALAGLLVHIATFIWPDAHWQQFGSFIAAVANIGVIIFLLSRSISQHGQRKRSNTPATATATETVPASKLSWRDWLFIAMLVYAILFMFVWLYLILFGSDGAVRDMASLRLNALTVTFLYYSFAHDAWKRVQKLRGGAGV